MDHMAGRRDYMKRGRQEEIHLSGPGKTMAMNRWHSSLIDLVATQDSCATR